MTSPPRRSLLLFVSDPATRDLIGGAFEGLFEPIDVGDWSELRQAISGAAPGTVVVVDPYAGTDCERPTSELRELLEEFPSATVVAALDPGNGNGRYQDVLELTRWGVAEVLPLGDEGGPHAIRHRIESCRSAALRRFLSEGLPSRLAGQGRAILEAAVEVAMDDGYPKELGERLGMSAPTLNRQCHRSGLPTPRKLLQWLRVLRAASLLDDPGHTVASVALACGYANDDSLRRAIRSVVPESPTELRELGAFAAVSEAFAEVLKDGRE